MTRASVLTEKYRELNRDKRFKLIVAKCMTGLLSETPWDYLKKRRVRKQNHIRRVSQYSSPSEVKA